MDNIINKADNVRGRYMTARTAISNDNNGSVKSISLDESKVIAVIRQARNGNISMADAIELLAGARI